jgi:DNA-binding GntR family transcriptional regulator
VPAATEAAFERLRKMTARTSFDEINRCDVDFHAGVVDELGNARISTLYRELRTEEALSKSFQLEAWSRIHEERIRQHGALLDGIRTRRPDAAEEAIRSHLAWSFAQWRAAWERAGQS